MKTTERKSITPADAGLSITIASGPRGSVRDENWPCIEYTVQLMHRHKPIWTGEYRLGVGHVNHKKTLPGFTPSFTAGMQGNVLDAWRAGKTLRKTAEIMQAQADLAALFAKSQKVTPQLNDVCHSLLSDGSAYFDGQRFEDWASDLGYSSDSIKAKETFEACDKIGRDLSRALSRDDLEGLREWVGNY